MILPILLVTEFIHLIQGTDVCPPAPLFDPSCIARLIIPGCSTDQNCTKPGTKCCTSECNVLQCLESVPGDPVCPPYNEDAICTRFDEQCDSSDDCKEGDMCCPVECGTTCKTPYRPPNDETCPPRVQLCILIPPGACSKENFLIIDGGVKCLLCPSIIPCNKDCLLPVETGPCKAAFTRYYYDVDTNSCTEFIYGGCQGNNNNFNSLQECEEKCSTEPGDPVVKPGRCPTNNDPHLVCPAVVRPGDCSDDSSCLGDQKCCKVGCFRTCVNPGPDCPPVCHIYCEFGYVLDSNGCPTCTCKGNPCPPNPRCPTPPEGPPGTCPPLCRFIYEEIDGVKCKVRCEIGPPGPQGPPCPPTNCIQGPTEPIPPPPPSCEQGSPLANVRCGISGETCPNGYYCNSDVCCQIPCKNGSPHPTLTCGQVAGSHNCPPGYSCLVHPADAYFACCPDDPPVTGNCPYGNPLPHIFCGRGPGRQECPSGYSCNVDPADRFAVCCSNEICPAVLADSICYEYTRDCQDDSSCADGRKCCRQGCSYVCVNPN